MKQTPVGFRLTASDLSGYLACRHLIELERAAAEGRIERAVRDDPALERLIQRGVDFEKEYVQVLRAQGLEVVDLREAHGAQAVEITKERMRCGADVIVQGALGEGRWGGRADILLKQEDSPSALGGWSYEVLDTKLARQTKAGTILQLCLYTDLLASMQGRPPDRFHVVRPSGEETTPFEIEVFRFADFQAYYRLVRRGLESQVDSGPERPTYPEPVPHCEVCSWWAKCDRKRRDDDHLSLVAGMSRLHAEELRRQGVTTLAAFAEREEPLNQHPDRGSEDAYARLHAQARIQLAGRLAGAPKYEFLSVEAGRGFSKLPESSPGDLFFDIESNPFAGIRGLEYLFGFATLTEEGPEFRRFWALNSAEERKIFEAFLDFLMERWERYPEMHIYHFSPYEPAALKRLMGRYAICEDEVDRLLRGGRFIDLHTVTRQGMRLSVESYSLKELERFYGFERDLPLAAARSALNRINFALELHIPDEISSEDQAAVEAYNRDDCISTLRLRDWLESRRQELIAIGVEVPRPELAVGDASERIQERRAEVQAVYDRLVEDLPEDEHEWNSEQKAKSLLANMLDYFRREEKCVWWEFFRINELEDEELLYERKAVAGLQFVGEIEGGTARCPVHRYSFPDQEVAFADGVQLIVVGNFPIRRVGTVSSLDLAARTLDIKKRQDSRAYHPQSVAAFERVPSQGLEDSLLAFATSVADFGLDGPRPFRAARDFLIRAHPRFEDHEPGRPLRRQGESPLEAALRIAPRLQESSLPVQGPPGSGKTFTGAQLIVSLSRQRKKIGVTAVSHAVIRNLLDDAIEAADKLGLALDVTHKNKGDDGGNESGRIRPAMNNQDALNAIRPGSIVGGTCWLWSRDEAVETLDYLFLDEAGQLSLPMILAASRSARNLILLGDPQQLQQPQQGSHPDGTEVSALEYLLQGNPTIRDDRGLFLETTWRLHPGICAFTSEIYYEDRLESLEGLDRQTIQGQTSFLGSGLMAAPVEHTGNQNSSLEEVKVIAEIVRDLLQPGNLWTDREGKPRDLTKSDILIIAPYNAQVGALTRRLGSDFRIGTVDKFQGQEAPVVIYSMTSSSADDAPRGMSFLYNPNRFNVATSRARCICILVGSPALFEPECRTPEQMRWANAFCRYRELVIGEG